MKNCQEWSLEFDLLYNNIMSDKAPGLNEYEKSVFLTRAEQNVVIRLYNGTLGKSFEETEEITAYLNSLVSQSNCSEVSGTAQHIIDDSQVFELPEDILFRTLELCKVSVDGCGEMTADVVPVTQDEFWRTSRNPFKGPNKSRVLRLSYGEAGEFGTGTEQFHYSELISKYPVSSYTVRYLKNPEPIILKDLEDGLTIDGQSEAKTCMLHESLHSTILNEAVRLAKAIWIS